MLRYGLLIAMTLLMLVGCSKKTEQASKPKDQQSTKPATEDVKKHTPPSQPKAKEVSNSAETRKDTGETPEEAINTYLAYLKEKRYEELVNERYSLVTGKNQFTMRGIRINIQSGEEEGDRFFFHYIESLKGKTYKVILDDGESKEIKYDVSKDDTISSFIMRKKGNGSWTFEILFN